MFYKENRLMRTLNKLIALAAAAILSLGMLVLTACGGTATAYTVYVKDASGTAIAGVRIGICSYDETTGEKGSCLAPKTTDADGKVVIEADEGVYVINDELFSNSYTAEKCVLKAYSEYTLVLTAK